MLDFILFTATLVVFLLVVGPFYVMVEKWLDKTFCCKEGLGFSLVVVTLVIFFAFYWHTTAKITLPAVFEESYVAIYKNDQVVEMPYGAVEYIHGNIFRVPIAPMSRYTTGDNHFGDTILNYSPFIILGQMRYQVEITDTNLFYSEPGTRDSSPFSYHVPWINKRFKELQLQELRTLMTEAKLAAYGYDDKNCSDSKKYFEAIRSTVDKEARLKGFSIKTLKGDTGRCH